MNQRIHMSTYEPAGSLMIPRNPCIIPGKMSIMPDFQTRINNTVVKFMININTLLGNVEAPGAPCAIGTPVTAGTVGTLGRLWRGRTSVANGN